MNNKETNDKLTREQIENYRFLDYRLNQIEKNLREGQQRIEQETNKQNKQVLNILNKLQQQAVTNQENISLLKQKVASIEVCTNKIDKLNKAADINSTKIKELERRLDIYKALLLASGTAAISSILIGVIQLIH